MILFKLHWMFQPLFNCLSEVEKVDTKEKQKQETSNNKGRLVPFWKRQEEAKCIITHLALWRGGGGIAITIQWAKKRGGEKSIRDRNQKNTKPSLFWAIISIFLMTEFSKLESTYSNSSEIFSIYFWDSFSLWFFPEHNSIYF